MRAIKFRAWVNNHWTNWLPTDVIYGKQNTILIDPKEYEADNRVIEQYTGLKDKNGKEIYEGDIVKDAVCKWEVLFEKGKFICESGDIKIDVYDLVDVEVIGNVHENPELLK